MTATTIKATLLPARLSWIVLLPIVLAAAVFIVFQFLPFAHQPTLGATTIPVLTEARSNNELDLPTNGLILIPLAAGVLLLLGLWNVANVQMSRATAAMTAVIGVMVLEYYVIFAMDYSKNEATYLGSMGIGFWALLALAVVMIVQGFVPRPAVSREFQLRSIIGNQESAIVIALVALVLVIGITNSRFLSTNNVLDVLQGNAYIAVAAIGMSMVIITGNIDISVGSMIGLLAIVSGRLVVAGVPVWIAWIAPLFVGMAIGALIGYLVAYLRVPAIVVTLGMFSILKGVLIIWTNGERVTDMPPDFYLAQMRPLGISMPIWFMIVLTILAAIWMRYSSLGRSLYAVGGNAEAARLSGISQQRVILQVFMINGFFAGIASVLYATQLNIIQATPPPALELAIITSAVVGGVSILGGKGTVIGAMLAAILLNAIRSGMIFINVSPFWIQAVQGILILVTVLIDLLRRRRQAV
jgi:ribose/xylose/arabinose/galactoside ABC-type transport system permease subunit